VTTIHDDDPPLSDGQRLLTAWVDGCLSAPERATFERLLADDPELAMQAARHKEVLDLSRSMQLMEPSDIESRKFWSRFYNRGEWQVGWCLLLVGTAILLTFAIYELLVSELPWIVKVGAMTMLLGGAILLWNTARWKLRTSRFDRYRGVLY
jgi:anti-sigma-K factor RskA